MLVSLIYDAAIRPMAWPTALDAIRTELHFSNATLTIKSLPSATEDLKAIDVPTFVMHGTDDQIVPCADAGPLEAKLLRHGSLRTFEGLPHGICTTHAEVINADLLAFIKA